MATKIFINKSTVSCVYDDRFRPFFEALGVPVIQRASNVEFNHETQEWEAQLPDGQTIAKGTNRDQVITDEVKYLEENNGCHIQ